MKLFIAFILALASMLAHADVTLAPLPAGTYTLMRSTSNVQGGYPTAAACQAAAGLHAEALKSSANYRCRLDLVFAVTYKAPPAIVKPPQPADQKQDTACTNGAPGTFPQTKTATYNPATNAWDWGEWSPATAPLGLCTVVVATPPATGMTTPMGLMPAVNLDKMPARGAAYTAARVQAAPHPFANGDSQGPTPSDSGSFRLGCTFSHMGFYDPLVNPGNEGPDLFHLHTFVGNAGINKNSTSAALATGGSTCAGGTLNMSAYWFPTMIDTTDGTPIAPSGFLVYYKTGYGGVKLPDINVIPEGLHMISGSAGGNPSSPSTAGRFVCVGGNNGVGWQATIPPNCYKDNQLIMEVSFPQCWDGVNLDSIDHKAHMAETTGSGCPTTHPVALPHISFEIYYDLAKVNLANMKNWRLSSDNYATTSPGGYSAHGDYMFKWGLKTIQTFTKNCNNVPTDCHANLLGDGTWLY